MVELKALHLKQISFFSFERIKFKKTTAFDLGRELEVQIRKLNTISSYLIDHTVSQVQ